MKARTGAATKSRVLARKNAPPSAAIPRTLRAILSALMVLLTWSASFIFYRPPDRVQVVIGEPSPRDIKAPRQLLYISQVKTEEARLQAAARVNEVYVGPDMQIAIDQVRALQTLTDEITALRQGTAARAIKLTQLRELDETLFSESLAIKLLDLTDAQWQDVAAEALQVLNLIMRDEIRGLDVSSAQSRAGRLSTRVLSNDQYQVMVALAKRMIVANTFYDADQTAALRTAARDAVEPVQWIIRQGESILREGEIVSSLAYEKLAALDLLETGRRWQDVVGYVLLSTTMIVMLSVYVLRSQPLLLYRPRREALFALALIVGGVLIRILVPGRALMPYLFPTAAIAMLVTILLDAQLALMSSALMALLVGLSAGGSAEVALYAFVGSMIGSLTISKMDYLGAFVRAAVYIALGNAAIILAFHLHRQVYDAVGLLQLLGAAMSNGALSASLAFVAFSFIGRVFGITTSLQLLELARPTHPLFRQLLMNAPGTYHHSIVVSNMAERAAEAIGADALLARVAAYYHDIGKISRPYFFAENQSDGENPHDKLDPKTSAEIIIAHVQDGIELARKYHLPDKVIDSIPEHHGTTLVTYFYRRASQDENAAAVDQDLFRYPGPRPQSKETAILMLADSIEAIARAKHPATQAELERIIRQVINDRLVSGQLDECDLTLKDLDTIRQAFAGVLQGIFHPRIQYPDKVTQKAQSCREQWPIRISSARLPACARPKVTSRDSFRHAWAGRVRRGLLGAQPAHLFGYLCAGGGAGAVAQALCQRMGVDHRRHRVCVCRRDAQHGRRGDRRSHHSWSSIRWPGRPKMWRLARCWWRRSQPPQWAWSSWARPCGPSWLRSGISLYPRHGAAQGGVMDYRLYWRIVLRRWWLVVGLVLVAGASYLALTPRAAQAYSASMRFVVGIKPEASSGDYYTYDRYYTWLTAEYLVDDLSEVVKSAAFAKDVAALAQLDVPVGAIQGATSAGKLHRILTVSVTWGDAEQLARIANAIVATLTQHGESYFAQLATTNTAIANIDPPIVTPVGRSLRQRLDLPLRLILALIAGVALAFLLDYLDASIRHRADLAALGLPILAEIPRGRGRRRAQP